MQGPVQRSIPKKKAQVSWQIKYAEELFRNGDTEIKLSYVSKIWSDLNYTADAVEGNTFIMSSCYLKGFRSSPEAEASKIEELYWF